MKCLFAPGMIILVAVLFNCHEHLQFIFLSGDVLYVNVYCARTTAVVSKKKMAPFSELHCGAWNDLLSFSFLQL